MAGNLLTISSSSPPFLPPPAPFSRFSTHHGSARSILGLTVGTVISVVSPRSAGPGLGMIRSDHSGPAAPRVYSVGPPGPCRRRGRPPKPCLTS
eukprot:538881-Hanusia_phi.AAC.1